MGERLVLDLETQREFGEVQGRKPELLGVSLVGVYSYADDQYTAYREAELASKLGPRLKAAELLIGFNIRRFDLPVLQPYLDFQLSTLPVLDIMEEIVKNLGHRVSLGSLAHATLGDKKSGSGLDALRWFKEGRFDLIEQYCLDDVRLTKEIYEYGKAHGRLFATSKFSADKLQIAVFWPERTQDVSAVTKMLHETLKKRLQVEIEYVSQRVGESEPAHTVRRVDVYYIREPSFEGYCHLRKDLQQFRIDRVINIKPTWNRYTIPADYVPSAMAG